MREYIEMLHDAGAKMYGCKMTVDMFGIKKEDFLPQEKVSPHSVTSWT